MCPTAPAEELGLPSTRHGAAGAGPASAGQGSPHHGVTAVSAGAKSSRRASTGTARCRGVRDIGGAVLNKRNGFVTWCWAVLASCSRRAQVAEVADVAFGPQAANFHRDS